MANKSSSTTNGTVSNSEIKNTENNKNLGSKNIKIVFPIPKNERGQAFSNLDEIMAHVSGESTGNYLLGRNGMWHSGIHITNATTPWCALSGNSITEKACFPAPYKGKQAIRCMADGEIVAYRMNQDYLPLGWKTGSLNLSGSFVLVRHYIQPGETQKSGLRFYTLYMHLAPYSAYQANPSWIVQDKLPAYAPEWKTVAGTQTYKDQHKLDALPKGSIIAWDKKDSQRQLKAANGRLYGLVTIEKIAGSSKLNVGTQCWTLVDNNNILPEIEPSWWKQLASPAKEMMQFDKVVSLTTPITIKAGESIGHMGFYQAPKEQGIDSRYQVHIECISADDNLPQFLQNPDKVGHDNPQYLKCLPGLMLWNKQGDDFIKTERVVEWEKTFKLSEIKVEKDKNSNEFYLLPEYLGAIPKIALSELNEIDKQKSQESTFGALGKKTNELGAIGHQDQLIKENIYQYSKLLSQYDLSELGFNALVANASAFDHLNGHVQSQVEFISAVYENIKAEITGSSVPQKGIIAHNYQRLINKIKSDKKETYSPEEYRRAFHNPMFSHIVNKTNVKHPSDWYYKKSDSVWQNFLNMLSEEAPLWRSYSEEFLDNMVWMQDVTNEKIGPEVWHMHPLVFLDSFKVDKETYIIFPLRVKPKNDINGIWKKYYWKANLNDSNATQAIFGRPRGKSRLHAARDLYTDPNEAVVAVCDGIVKFISTYYANTWQVTIEHKSKDGREFYARYGELEKASILVKEGDRVNLGQHIGNTGYLTALDKDLKLQHIKVIPGEIVYMLHFETYTNITLGAPPNNTNGKNPPYDRRHDLVDSVDILIEGYNNTFKENLNKKKVKRPKNVQDFLDMAGETAKAVSSKWNVPASVLLAQAGLESNWGNKVIGNAYFGIKGKSPSGNSVTFNTSEEINGVKEKMDDVFRAYESFEEAAFDYGRFLNENKRYSKAFNYINNPDAFLKEVTKAGYATASGYEKLALKIMKSYDLYEFD